ncbi:U3 small nucleolar RNA-associated protein 20, N-terminal [Dillenia turbinata]|uniref:U3 small nucleolar RNA-associated protein 20, N-terminal n=1 Tax=Dillenia turbinata TaxID=194707 RepID=A0AAN8W5Q2_9MAGN
MATSSESQAVKSLNNSGGRRRFTFKRFSQRIEEIEIDVYRSLNAEASEPSRGSFFLDSLIEWRELNTAEDFISLYEEMMPVVQTLPLVLLQKEFIISKLLSRLQMKARLSLEPILRLIAALSRDLTKDFLPFLQRIADSLVSLLKSGADREPEVLEQIFMSWSYIMKYLQKYLVQDVTHILKITVHLRYYSKDYVREFMAESVSFLLRNAPEKQLIKGIRRITFEAVKKPSDARIGGAGALLFHVMIGSSSRFHSKARQVLQLLMDDCLLDIGNKVAQDSDTAVEVVKTSFKRLCEELEPEELNLFWECFFLEITDSTSNGSLLHLSRVLFLLVSCIQLGNGCKVTDYQQMLEINNLLIRTYILPSSGMVKDHSSVVVDRILQLMLCALDGLLNSNNMSTISGILSQWAPVFEIRTSSLLNFMRELLLKDPCIISAFKINIMSALNERMESAEEEVVYLMLTFFKRLNLEVLDSFLDGTSKEPLLRTGSQLEENIRYWIELINASTHDSQSSFNLPEGKMAYLWGLIQCCSYFPDTRSSILMDLVDVLDRLLMNEADEIAGAPRKHWQCLLGTALSSYTKMQLAKNSGLEHMSKYLHLAKRHKSSSQVLVAVAEYLDQVHGPAAQADTTLRKSHPVLEGDEAIKSMHGFCENLSHSDKMIRISTLRILCHYDPQVCALLGDDQPIVKKLKIEVSQSSDLEIKSNNVLRLLLEIETTPLSVATSRKLILLISRIQMGLSAARISEALIPLVLNGTIGVLHNRFSYMWSPVLECLVVLIGNYTTYIWDMFVLYLEHCQSVFLSSHEHDQLDGENAGRICKSNDLVESFKSCTSSISDSTPNASVLSLLIQSLQKIPMVAESRSRHIVPIFLKFLGYNNDDLTSVGSFNQFACKRREWNNILKEWLNLLRLMKNPKAFYHNQFLKEVLQNRLLDETDAEIQLKVLDCLLNWKDKFLVPYGEHLRNLINSKHLREELTAWSLSQQSPAIEEEHRPYLVPLVIQLLVPKVRSLKTLASRKRASVHHRKAVLGFLAQLEVEELRIFFSLLLKPLWENLNPTGETATCFWSLKESGFDAIEASGVFEWFTLDRIMTLSWKKRYGFMHVIEDIMGVFDELHIQPFLNLLVGCVVRVLGSCSIGLDNAKSGALSLRQNGSSLKPDLHDIDGEPENLIMTSMAVKQFKDLRSLCLKIISSVLNKYSEHDFGFDFWELFFKSVKPLVENFKKEASSSEKPSSLFSCFVAMSRSHNLVLHLDKEKSLVPDIFSILTVATASEAIVSGVLKFVEDLLNLDSELGSEDGAVKRVLLPNVDALIFSLHCLFQPDNASKRKSVRFPGETELRIFKLLSKYIKDPLPARRFVDILLLLVTKRANSPDVCIGALQVIQDLVLVVGSEATSKILNAVSPLLVNAGTDMRLSICDLLAAVAKVDHAVLYVAELLCKLNATTVIDLGGLDYDTVIGAYEKIDTQFFFTVQVDHALVILSHCVYDMASEELILRHSAYRLLLSFVEFSALVLGQEAKKCPESPEKVVKDASCRTWTGTSIQRLLNKFFLKHMADIMNKESSVKKEWVDLLREMVLRLPELPNLHSLKALSSADAEVDFFNNITHLQTHRRVRALSRFRNVLNGGSLSEVIVSKLFVPFFFNMLLDVQDGKGEHLRNACVDTLASISGCMPWKTYYALLLRCFHEMTLKLDKKKVLVRLICSILDQFHFSETCYSNDVQKLLGDSGLTSSTLVHCFSTAHDMTEIQTCLQKVVLPKLQKMLALDPEKVDVNISVATLKLLKLLPGDIMDSQLSSIVHRISNFLKSRVESSRDEARSALAACLKELGLDFLQFIVSVLRATLKRGYEVHVLGYTLHYILLKSLSNPVMGKLDYCLEDLIAVVENDILGDVAEEKEVEKIASKMKETRKCKSFESLKLIAQSITFKTHALRLLQTVTAHLQKHLSPKIKSKLETMLSYIASGIEGNPSVDQTDLFVFVFGLIEDGIKEENDQGESFASVKKDKEGRTIFGNRKIISDRIISIRSQSSHLITVFALGVLHNRTKNVKLDKNDGQLFSMLDPFIALLGNCLNSKYEDVLSGTLRCLTPLIKLPLPSLEKQADKIKKALLEIAQTLNANSPLIQSCLRLLTVLLQNANITLSTEQLHMLIQFPIFIDLERNPSFVALALLKSIVNRKLVVHEIYDIVSRVAEVMVTNQEEPIRRKCSEILLQFLLDYHLSEKRLQQHLDFLLMNLRYEHSTGREAVLEMLHAIIMKFPKGFVNEQSQTLFLHLITCLANDHDNKVRSMTGAAIKLLIGRMDAQSLKYVLEYSLCWYLGEKPQLWIPAAQVLGLLIEVMKKGFRGHVTNVLPVTRSILQSAIDSVAHLGGDITNETTIPLWKESYYSLVMLEKMLQQFPDLLLEGDLEDIWEAISEFLFHPHMWLRNISCRLVAFYFATTINLEKPLDEYFLLSPSRLFLIAAAMCCQLQAPVIEETAGNLIKQNFVFAICGLHSLTGQKDKMEFQRFWSSLEERDKACFLKAFQLLDSRKGRGMFAAYTSGLSGQCYEQNNENPQYYLVSVLLKRIGKIAIQMENVQMKIILDILRTLSSQIKDDCQRYAAEMLLPLYKVCEGFAGKIISDDVKQLAQEVRESIEDTMGKKNFLQVYYQIRKILEAKRDKRKQEEKIMAVVNPTRNAKRKLRISAKHRAHKRRKMMTMKMGRWMR